MSSESQTLSTEHVDPRSGIRPDAAPPRGVAISAAVLDELAFAAEYHPGSLLACILTGCVVDGVVRVSGFLSLSHHSDMESVVASLAGSWVPIGRRAARLDEGGEIVGWASVRPGSVAKISASEMRVHRSFFDRPNELTLMVDPDVGVFLPWHWTGSGFVQGRVLSFEGAGNCGENS